MQAVMVLTTGGLAVVTLVFGAVRLLLEPHEVTALGMAGGGRRVGLIRGRGTAELLGAAGLMSSALLRATLPHALISVALLGAAFADGMRSRREQTPADMAVPAVSALLATAVLAGLALEGS